MYRVNAMRKAEKEESGGKTRESPVGLEDGGEAPVVGAATAEWKDRRRGEKSLLPFLLLLLLKSRRRRRRRSTILAPVLYAAANPSHSKRRQSQWVRPWYPVRGSELDGRVGMAGSKPTRTVRCAPGGLKSLEVKYGRAASAKVRFHRLLGGFFSSSFSTWYCGIVCLLCA